MPKPLSYDLRSRVLAAVDGGLSCRQAAERFGVSPSCALRWAARRRGEGDARPRPQGGDRLSHRTEAHAAKIHAALAEVPDITLAELKDRLAADGAQASVAALWRFFRRHGITRKKDRARGRAGPPRRPDAPSGVVRRSTRPRPGAAGVHRCGGACADGGPLPTWPAPTAGRRGAAVCGPPCRTATGRPQPSWPACARAA